jgi:hypothetical protein
MSKYQSTNQNDKLALVQSQLTDVKIALHDNLEKAITRGDNLDVLLVKAEQLNDIASQFPQRARRLRLKMCWDNYKYGICAGFVVIGIIGVAIGLIVYASKNAN